MQDDSNQTNAALPEVRRAKSDAMSDASGGDDSVIDDSSLADDALAAGITGSQRLHNSRQRAKANNDLETSSAHRLVQSPVPLRVNGHTEGHVVIESRHPMPVDASVVPAQLISPFALTSLQARSASHTSSSNQD